MNPSALQMEQRRLGESSINAFNRSLYGVSVMKVEAVFQAEGLPLAHPISALIRFLLDIEMPVPEWISCKKPVIPDMPVGRMAETPGMVHDGDPDLLARNPTVIVNPFSRFAPAL